jgi:hypothetical protein
VADAGGSSARNTGSPNPEADLDLRDRNCDRAVKRSAALEGFHKTGRVLSVHAFELEAKL